MAAATSGFFLVDMVALWSCVDDSRSEVAIWLFWLIFLPPAPQSHVTTLIATQVSS